MEPREEFIENLIDTVNEIISAIDDREIIDTDFIIARELADQLRTEIEDLLE